MTGDQLDFTDLEARGAGADNYERHVGEGPSFADYMRGRGHVDLAETPLSRCRQYIKTHRGAGVVCPCCNKLVKIYARRLTSTFARFLALAYKANAARPVHVERFCSSNALPSGIAPRLGHWGLLAAAADKGRGWYRITRAGARFIVDGEAVPAAVYLAPGNELLGTSTETTTIDKALGDKFKIEDILEPVAPSKLSGAHSLCE